MAYMHADGIYQKYGTEKTTPNTAGEYVTTGAIREIEVEITLANLTEAETILSDTTVLPAGARIQEIEVITVTAAATGTAVDIGLIRTDRATEIDYDGLVAALVTASMNAAGETQVIRLGSTSAGALIGTTLANVGMITASATTATAFTAGVLHVKIRYFIP